MKKIPHFYLSIVLIFLSFFWILQACSTANTGFTSRAYHNITSLYNAYFLANERVKEVEKEIFDKRTENYNRVLDVIPFTDTTTLRTFATKLEDCIKKAATIPNRHETSKWLDASYVVIGKARFYLRDYENALNTFKYVNTKGKIPQMRNQALIELMRTYTEIQDFRAAKTVLAELSKRALDKTDRTTFLIVRGHFFRKQNDYIETAKSLGSAVKTAPKGEKKARLHFILGQIYQQLARDNNAFKNYKAVLKNNPTYELSFYARLYMAQVSKLSAGSDIKKINRYYKKLLKDVKNKDYKDKIYYEMALFELRQGSVAKAINYLNESVAANTNNALQRAYTYLKLADVNYSNLQKYELAKTYYDSVLIHLPQGDESYKDIQKRQKTLEEFVKQLTIYRTNDSLLRMAKMQEPALDEYISKNLLIEETKRQDEIDSLTAVQERREKLKKQENKGTLNESIAATTGAWYFYNPTTIALGQKAFTKKWGTRKLEDNWRRSKKESFVANDSAFVAEELSPEEFRQQAIQKRVEERKKAIYDSLPKTPEAVTLCDKKVEEAAYELGKIFKFKLQEPKNAVLYLEKLLERYPQTRHEAEALYFLYLLNQDLKNTTEQEKYKQKLLSKYPSSSYAKIISNPNYLTEAKENEVAVKEGYKKAYTDYEMLKYQEAKNEIDNLQKLYPDNLLTDRLEFLKLLIATKINRDKEKLKADITKFIADYPESQLQEYAKKMLEGLK